MKLHTIARRLPEEIWAIFEPLLPSVVWCGDGRPPASNHHCLHGLLYVLITGIGWEYVPPASLRPDPQGTLPGLAGARPLAHRLAAAGPTLRATARHQRDKNPPGRLQEAVKKRGVNTGPGPVDRSQCGTAIH